MSGNFGSSVGCLLRLAKLQKYYFPLIQFPHDNFICCWCGLTPHYPSVAGPVTVWLRQPTTVMQKTRLNEFELRSFQQDRNLPVLYNRDRILPVLYQGQKHNQINKTTVNESIGALLVRYLAVPLIYSVFSKLFGAKEDTASEDEALFPNHDEGKYTLKVTSYSLT